MNESRKIAVEEVDAVEAPKRARVEDMAGDTETASEKLERKRDYLEGFLAKQPENVSAGDPGGDRIDARRGRITRRLGSRSA